MIDRINKYLQAKKQGLYVQLGEEIFLYYYDIFEDKRTPDHMPLLDLIGFLSFASPEG